MPEYLAPGVYVEETSFRAKSIEGVSTSTTAFVGPTRKGPFVDSAVSDPERQDTPELLTSFGDFERIYGGFENLTWGTNYLAHAVRAYFDNGGSRLFVARVTSSSDAYRLLSRKLICPGPAVCSGATPSNTRSWPDATAPPAAVAISAKRCGPLR